MISKFLSILFYRKRLNIVLIFGIIFSISGLTTIINSVNYIQSSNLNKIYEANEVDIYYKNDIHDYNKFNSLNLDISTSINIESCFQVQVLTLKYNYQNLFQNSFLSNETQQEKLEFDSSLTFFMLGVDFNDPKIQNRLGDLLQNNFTDDEKNYYFSPSIMNRYELSNDSSILHYIFSEDDLSPILVANITSYRLLKIKDEFKFFQLFGLSDYWMNTNCELILIDSSMLFNLYINKNTSNEYFKYWNQINIRFDRSDLEVKNYKKIEKLIQEDFSKIKLFFTVNGIKFYDDDAYLPYFGPDINISPLLKAIHDYRKTSENFEFIAVLIFIPVSVISIWFLGLIYQQFFSNFKKSWIRLKINGLSRDRLILFLSIYILIVSLISSVFLMIFSNLIVQFIGNFLLQSSLQVANFVNLPLLFNNFFLTFLLSTIMGLSSMIILLLKENKSKKKNKIIRLNKIQYLSIYLILVLIIFLPTSFSFEFFKQNTQFTKFIYDYWPIITIFFPMALISFIFFTIEFLSQVIFRNSGLIYKTLSKNSSFLKLVKNVFSPNKEKKKFLIISSLALLFIFEASMISESIQTHDKSLNILRFGQDTEGLSLDVNLSNDSLSNFLQIQSSIANYQGSLYSSANHMLSLGNCDLQYNSKIYGVSLIDIKEWEEFEKSELEILNQWFSMDFRQILLELAKNNTVIVSESFLVDSGKQIGDTLEINYTNYFNVETSQSLTIVGSFSRFPLLIHADSYEPHVFTVISSKDNFLDGEISISSVVYHFSSQIDVYSTFKEISTLYKAVDPYASVQINNKLSSISDWNVVQVKFDLARALKIILINFIVIFICSIMVFLYQDISNSRREWTLYRIRGLSQAKIRRKYVQQYLLIALISVLISGLISYICAYGTINILNLSNGWLPYSLKVSIFQYSLIILGNFGVFLGVSAYYSRILSKWTVISSIEF
ncbi:MAG: FtsX-like permease family protein [Promethearchaeota archaeon]